MGRRSSAAASGSRPARRQRRLAGRGSTVLVESERTRPATGTPGAAGAAQASAGALLLSTTARGAARSSAVALVLVVVLVLVVEAWVWAMCWTSETLYAKVAGQCGHLKRWSEWLALKCARRLWREQ